MHCRCRHRCCFAVCSWQRDALLTAPFRSSHHDVRHAFDNWLLYFASVVSVPEISVPHPPSRLRMRASRRSNLPSLPALEPQFHDVSTQRSSETSICSNLDFRHDVSTQRASEAFIFSNLNFRHDVPTQRAIETFICSNLDSRVVALSPEHPQQPRCLLPSPIEISSARLSAGKRGPKRDLTARGMKRETALSTLTQTWCYGGNWAQASC